VPPRAYTISKLAKDADVSVHIVRNYEQRGLLCACERMNGGFHIYDEHALLRMRFIRAGIGVGIALDDMATLLNSLDNDDAQNLAQVALQLDDQLIQKMQLKHKFCLYLKHLVRLKTIPSI